MHVIPVHTARPYDVHVGTFLLERAGEITRSVCRGERAAVVTDTNVGPLYADVVRTALAGAGFEVSVFTFEAGEASKRASTYIDLLEFLAEQQLGRADAVVALGGGVVGDLAGFVAACYMRGVPVVQVPTTLLSMVDSSVGGKAGVNLAAGKNLVGAFKQPSFVCADTGLLSSLPDREWACGCGEIAKCSVIDSDEFFFWLSDHAGDLARREPAVTEEAIARSVVFKADVVAEDKTESRGVRECLNYGHTLGHAVEKLAGYGVFSHGAAVAEGMRFAARLGQKLIGTSADLVSAQDALLDELGLPALAWSAPPEDMLAAMKRDKKARHGVVRFVMPRDIGDWELREVGDDVILDALREWEAGKRAQGR